MKALLDGDILRYEVGFGAEQGWQSEGFPPWEYVCDLLHQRIDNIVALAGADNYQIYLTGCKSFRYDIAKTKPYKGHRKQIKPWHWKNLTAYMIGALGAEVTKNGLEADDAMSIENVSNPEQCIICSRDKDLRQVEGLVYSWELGAQPSFGPVKIDKYGTLEVNKNNSLSGTGFAWFCAQVLMGDVTDNIPGLKGYGPIRTYEYLKPMIGDTQSMLECLREKFNNDDYLLEQCRLCWMTRRLTSEGTPEMWELGMTQ